jgi:hypothetical protein
MNGLSGRLNLLELERQRREELLRQAALAQKYDRGWPLLGRRPLFQIVYMLTPNKVSVPLQSSPTSWEDFFVVVYPITSTLTLTCMHKPMDNCPDRGPDVAKAAMAINPAVYGAGVLGHDHVFHVPGPPGGEFNANWAVKLVLFNSFSDADKSLHLTTVDQIMAAQASGKVTIIDTPISFLCAVVPAALYQRATPVTPVPGIP